MFDHLSGEYLSTAGANIYYEIIGDQNAPVLLVLHGGFGTLEDFNVILPHLTKTFRVVGIDSRGQGKSTLGSQALTYAQLQEDVEHVLEKLDIDTLSILGFSDGGITAYRLASLTSLNIDKLVTIGSRWHLKHAEATREMFLKITGKSWKEKFPDTYSVYQTLNPEPDFDLLTHALIDMWLDPQPSGYPNEAIKNISCPTLVVRGDDDHLVSREAVFEASTLIENATLLNIPFAGHDAFITQKEVFMISLNEFLKYPSYTSL